MARFAFLRGSALRADGSSVASAYVLSWSLVTAGEWITRSMSVDVRGPGWSRSLELVRDDERGWEGRTTVRGTADLPHPGLDDRAALDEALDCDLALCPATNAMPILRLASADPGAAAASELVMALIEVPSLRVVRSEQAYELVERHADGGLGVGFRARPDFRAHLEADADGLVTHYPGLATAVAGDSG